MYENLNWVFSVSRLQSLNQFELTPSIYLFYLLSDYIIAFNMFEFERYLQNTLHFLY